MRGPGARRRSGIRNEGRRAGWGLRPHARSGGTPIRLRRHRRLRLVASGHLRAEELPPVPTAAADASPCEKGPGWAHGVGLSPLAVAPAGSLAPA